MLILPSDMYIEKKPPCVREIIEFLKKGGASFLLYGFKELPIESNLHLIKDIFPWYYTPSGALSADTYIRNMYGNLFYTIYPYIQMKSLKNFMSMCKIA